MKQDTLIPFLLLLAGLTMCTAAIGLFVLGNWMAGLI
jgi:hypothetical protein